ncbi:hypothetical protein ACTFIR_011638 [Dictyostelium discoideum]
MQSFNLESFGKNLDKKLRRNPEQLQQQPTINYKSERERDIHELIFTIKSERMFIYKNAHRHLKLALENVTLALNLPMLLKDFHVTLKEFDALEASLNAELECIELQYSIDSSVDSENAITTAIASLSVNPVNTTASTSTSTPTTTTTTTTTSKNNNSTLVSKPKTRGVRSKSIDMNSSDDDEKDDQDKDDDSDEDNVDNTPPLDSKPPSSKTKEISKTKTRGNVSTAITTTTPITTTDSAIIGTTTDSTIIGTTTTTTTTDDTSEESKIKVRPPKIYPECCYVCKVTETSYWRRGTDNGVVVDLCNSCGLYYMKKEKKERLSRQKHSIKNVLN